MYRVYGKKKGDKKYKPFDMYHNGFVTKLIHASIFPDNKHSDLVKEIDFMNQQNGGFHFKIKKFSM